MNRRLTLNKLSILISLACLSSFNFVNSSISLIENLNDPCIDFPSCYLISEKMFENYCDRATLKNMCPTFCNKNCKNSTSLSTFKTSTETTTLKLTTTSITSGTTVLSSLTSPTIPTTSSSESKAKFKFKLISRKNNTKYQTNQSTTTTTTMLININETLRPINTMNSSKYLKYYLFIPSNQTIGNSNQQTTKNPTIIYVPLFEAGFVQKVNVTSSKKNSNYSVATVCKRDSCERDAVWQPETNNIPKEQIEFFFNHTTDIYLLETQGDIFTNQTVTQFLFQYSNDTNTTTSTLNSKILKTNGTNSSKRNKFIFIEPLKALFVRITPLEYAESIAMRFEIYSKGILYN